jgi:hypothetical protein
MDGCELRDALKTLFNDDASAFSEAVSTGRRNASNLIMGRYGVTGPLRVLVRLLMRHPYLVDEIKGAPNDMLFVERHAAREEKARDDADALAFHRRVVALLADPCRSDAIVVDAKGRVAKWEQRGLCSPYYIDAWNVIIGLPIEAMESEMLRDDEEGIALRQNTPFWLPEEEAA